MIYLPSYAFLTGAYAAYEEEIEPTIRDIDRKTTRHPSNILFDIRYVKTKINTDGFDIEVILLNLMNENYKYISEKSDRSIEIDISKLDEHNCVIHFINDKWRFYYPKSYENVVLKNKIYKSKEIFTINEYWIKNIIE